MVKHIFQSPAFVLDDVREIRIRIVCTQIRYVHVIDELRAIRMERTGPNIYNLLVYAFEGESVASRIELDGVGGVLIQGEAFIREIPSVSLALLSFDEN